MRKLLFLLITVCTIAFAADARTVKGKVVNASDNEPLIGATVMPVGQGQGVATDVDGAFVLNIANSVKQIKVSYVGYVTKTVNVSDNMLVALETSDHTLDDVVVVGYGSQKREAKTGAITTVKADEIKDVPATSIDKMLSGKLAGVMITSSSGQPGSGTSIRVRGTSSINAGNNPLYVVDGIPVSSGDEADLVNTNNAIAAINPSDIESVTVLKDAAAASVYGSRAANGVILITTKSGQAGKNTFNVRARFGVSALANDNNVGIMTGQELLQYQRDAVINAGKNPDDPTVGASYYRPYELLSRPQTNWMDHFTRLGKMQEYEISASGGSNKTTYYSSLNYHDNQGIYYGVDYKKIGARFNVDHELSQYLKTGVRMNLGYTYSEDIPMQSLYYSNPAFAGMTLLPWTPAYDENGNHNTDIPENSYTNPRATAEYDDQSEKTYNIQGNIYLEWKPLRQLTLRTNNGAEMKFKEGRRYWSLEASNYADGYPVLQTTNTQYRTLTTSNTATWQDVYNDVHNLRVLVGQEATHDTYHYYYGSSDGLNPNIPYHSSGSNYELGYGNSTATLMSFLGIADYNYDGRYYLQLSGRYDGSSKFGKNKQWGFFYAIGASWNAHNEAFMQEYKSWLNMAKLRVSYGINGNDNIGSYGQYGVYASSYYNGVTGLIPSTPANPDLSWEKNKSLNVGIDFGFVNRVTGSIDFYTRKTDDMLLSKTQSSTSGFNSILSNIGSMRNTGIEFQVDVNIIDNKDWQWNAGFNLSHNKTKILELSGEEFLSYSGDSRLRHVVGKSMFTFYLRDYYGVNPVNGEALWVAEDGSLSNNMSDARWIYAGSPEPKLTGGINTTVSWKNFSLSAVGEFKVGNKVYIGAEYSYLNSDGTQMSMNQMTSALNYWKKPGDTNCNPKPIAGNTTNSNNMGSDRWLENGSYFRIKDVTLSYTLPKNLLKKAGISNVRVYGSGMNLYTFHDVNFWDPERGVAGLGYGIYPVTKTFVLGLDVTF